MDMFRYQEGIDVQRKLDLEAQQDKIPIPSPF